MDDMKLQQNFNFLRSKYRSLKFITFGVFDLISKAEDHFLHYYLCV